jgi:hypothetical protein
MIQAESHSQIWPRAAAGPCPVGEPAHLLDANACPKVAVSLLASSGPIWASGFAPMVVIHSSSFAAAAVTGLGGECPGWLVCGQSAFGHQCCSFGHLRRRQGWRNSVDPLCRLAANLSDGHTIGPPLP